MWGKNTEFKDMEWFDSLEEEGVIVEGAGHTVTFIQTWIFNDAFTLGSIVERK